jgi:hypothetical protein
MKPRCPRRISRTSRRPFKGGTKRNPYGKRSLVSRFPSNPTAFMASDAERNIWICELHHQHVVLDHVQSLCVDVVAASICSRTGSRRPTARSALVRQSLDDSAVVPTSQRPPTIEEPREASSARALPRSYATPRSSNASAARVKCVVRAEETGPLGASRRPISRWANPTS